MSTLYTRTGDGLQAVEVPGSLANEVGKLQRAYKDKADEVRELRGTMRAALALLELEALPSNVVLDARVELRKALEG